MKKILIYWNITEEQLDSINAVTKPHGYEAVLVADAAAACEYAETHADEVAVLYGNDPAPIRLVKEPEWFCSYFAGADQYMGIIPDGCLLTNSAGAYGVTIAEHIIMVTLIMMRNHVMNQDIMAKTDWSGKDAPMDSLYGCRVTVLATGDIGRTFANRVRGFKPARVVGVNRSGKKPTEDFDFVVKQSELASVLPETDLLVMSMPNTAETRGMIGREMLDLLPDSAYIVNVGRGSAIDEAELVKALDEGRLAGASLDVMCTEPMPADDPLRGAKNIVLTPHVAGQMNLAYTREKAIEMFLEDFENFVNGRPMRYEVDRTIGY